MGNGGEITHKDNQSLAPADNLAESRPVAQGQVTTGNESNVLGAGSLEDGDKLLDENVVIAIGDEQGHNLVRVSLEPGAERDENLLERPDVEQRAVGMALADLTVDDVNLSGEVAHSHVHARLGVLELVVRGKIAHKGGIV